MTLFGIYCIIVLYMMPFFAGALRVPEFCCFRFHGYAILHLAIFVEIGIVEMGVSVRMP